MQYSSRQESSDVRKFQSLYGICCRLALEWFWNVMWLNAGIQSCTSDFYVWLGFTACVRDIIETLMASVVRNFISEFWNLWITLLPGADGTTRVVTGPTSILPKTTGQQTQSLIKIQAPVTAAPTSQQRVQILKGPDGKLQVRGLMPGMINICRYTTVRIIVIGYKISVHTCLWIQCLGLAIVIRS